MDNQKGFTLIEMLVVVAIIGILSTIVVIGVRGAREGARDAKRISDLRTIAANLELLYQAGNWNYPDPVSGDYPALSQDWPVDPLTNRKYYYSNTGTGDVAGQSYVLAACLERDRPTGLVHDSTASISNPPIPNYGSCMNCDTTPTALCITP